MTGVHYDVRLASRGRAAAHTRVIPFAVGFDGPGKPLRTPITAWARAIGQTTD